MAYRPHAAAAEQVQLFPRLIEDLFALAQHDGNEAATEFEPILVQRVVPTILGRERERLPGITILADFPDELQPGAADAGYLDQILGNLLSNAAK